METPLFSGVFLWNKVEGREVSPDSEAYRGVPARRRFSVGGPPTENKKGPTFVEPFLFYIHIFPIC